MPDRCNYGEGPHQRNSRPHREATTTFHRSNVVVAAGLSVANNLHTNATSSINIKTSVVNYQPLAGLVLGVVIRPIDPVRNDKGKRIRA